MSRGFTLHDAVLARSALRSRSEEAVYAEDKCLAFNLRRGLSFVEPIGGCEGVLQRSNSEPARKSKQSSHLLKRGSWRMFPSGFFFLCCGGGRRPSRWQGSIFIESGRGGRLSKGPEGSAQGPGGYCGEEGGGTIIFREPKFPLSASARCLVAQCSATPATVPATPPCSATPFQTQISVRHLPGMGGGRCNTKIFRGL